MKQQVWIIGRQKGQLGNRLMFFAHVYAWCLHTGRELYYPSFGAQADFFPALAHQRCNSVGDPSPVDWPLPRRLAFQKGFIARKRLLARFHLIPVLNKPSGHAAIGLPPSYNAYPPPALDSKPRVYLLGWRFLNPAGIQQYRRQILAALEPTPEIRADADAFRARLDPSRLWLAVHIRGTDYRTFLGGRHFLSLETVNAAMAAAVARFAPQPLGFAIFSDEPRTPQEFPGFTVAISGGRPEQDLFRMSTLPGALGPMSTFSTWAMYRSGGALWQLGPDPKEDRADWAFNGWPVERDPDRWAKAVQAARTGGVFLPPPDLSQAAMHPMKLGR
jgi:hypothetical protein